MEKTEIVSTFKANREMYLHFLDSVGYDTLISKMKVFENLDFRNMAEEDISQEFIRLLNVEGHFVHNITVNTLNEKLYFTRIRVIRNDNDKLDLSWFLERPFDPNKRPNRFDFRDKPVLYTSLTLGCAISEVNIGDNSTIVEIKYSNPGPLSIITIGDQNCPFLNNNWGEGLTKSQKKKDELIRDFVYRMLMYDSADTGTSHRVSKAVSKCVFYGLDADCILYPSVRCKTNCDYNIAFLDGSKKVQLEFALVRKGPSFNPAIGIMFDNGRVICTTECQPIVREKNDKLNEWYIKMGFQQIDMDDLMSR